MQIPQCDTVIPGKISCFINTRAAFPNLYTLLKLKQKGYCLASFLDSTPVAPCQLSYISQPKTGKEPRNKAGNYLRQCSHMSSLRLL